MIWTEPGNQIKNEAESIVEGFVKYGKKCYIFGAGIVGANIYPLLKNQGCFAGFIDSDKKKQSKGYLGEVVFPLEQVLASEEIGWIIVGVSEKYRFEVEFELQKNGLVHNLDYFFSDEILGYYWPIIAAYCYDNCFMQLCQICLTERCTLKCEKCAHGCYNVPWDAQDLSWEDFCLTVESFFGKIDYIYEFVLIGGEPLLYKNLSDAIQYIGERYRDKIGIFSITTNGTIVPEEGVLKMSEQFSVLYRISNYTGELPQLEKQYEKLIKALDKKNVEWRLSKPDGYWLDYGFETVNHTWNEATMAEFFDGCKTPCREIRKNRLYYCVMARSISDNLGFHEGEQDFLDIGSLGEDYKKIILEYNLGYSHKGYLDMCRHCNGGEKSNVFKIPVARQKK